MTVGIHTYMSLLCLASCYKYLKWGNLYDVLKGCESWSRLSAHSAFLGHILGGSFYVRPAGPSALEEKVLRGAAWPAGTLCADSTCPSWVPWLCVVPLLDAVHTAVCRKSSCPNYSTKWLVLIYQGRNPRADHTKQSPSCQELGGGGPGVTAHGTGCLLGLMKQFWN